MGLNAPNIVFPICAEWSVERDFKETLIKTRESNNRHTYDGARSSVRRIGGNGIKLKIEIFLETQQGLSIIGCVPIYVGTL